MDIELTIEYEEKYLPTPRCKKFRTRPARSPITLPIPETSPEDAPVAFIISRPSFGSEHIELRWYQKQLWKIVNWSEMDYRKRDTKGPLPLEEIKTAFESKTIGRDPDELIKKLRQYASEFLIIGDSVYWKTKEPLYAISAPYRGSFEQYRLNITQHCDSYNECLCYNALQRELALDSMSVMAKRESNIRGKASPIDASDEIAVLIPEAVQANPQEEYRKKRINSERCQLLCALPDPSKELVLTIAVTIGLWEGRNEVAIPKGCGLRDLVADVIDHYYDERLAGNDPELQSYIFGMLHRRFCDVRRICRSDFDYHWAGSSERKVLVIEDLDLGGMSVTNDAENVLIAISQETERDLKSMVREHPTGPRIVYRDSTGNYDEIIWNGSCVEFSSLGVEDESKALAALKKKYTLKG